jgi:hypothetical protein
LAGVSVVVVVVFFSVSTGASVVVVEVVEVVAGVGVVLLVVVFLEQPIMVVAPKRMRAARPVDLNMGALYRNSTTLSIRDPTRCAREVTEGRKTTAEMPYKRSSIPEHLVLQTVGDLGRGLVEGTTCSTA